MTRMIAMATRTALYRVWITEDYDAINESVGDLSGAIACETFIQVPGIVEVDFVDWTE